MMRTTQKALKTMVANGQAQDITNGTNETRSDIMQKEDYLQEIAYAAGIYGCNGILFKGRRTGTLYAITDRTSAIFIFG